MVVVVKPGLPTRNQKLFSGETLDCATVQTHVSNGQMDAAVNSWVLVTQVGDFAPFVPFKNILLLDGNPNILRVKKKEYFHPLDHMLQVLAPTFTH